MHLLRYKLKETPPDRWRYKCKRTGHRIESMNKTDWLKEIKQFHVNNEFPLDENWQAIAEHELCTLLPPGFCEYDNGGRPPKHMETRSMAATIVAGTRVAWEFQRQGFPLVSPEVAEERAKTCAACYAAVPIPGCGGCVGLANMVMDIVGKGTTTADNHLRLKSCAWCGCSALASVWMPVEVSEKGVTDAMLAPDASPPFCWKSEAVRAFRNQS